MLNKILDGRLEKRYDGGLLSTLGVSVSVSVSGSEGVADISFFNFIR